MARAVTIGNGNLLVGLDHRGQVRDLYYPYVGHANHVSGASGAYVHRIGVFVDGRVSWLDDPAWQITVGCNDSTNIGTLFAVNDQIGISLASKDAVHNERDVLLREFTITNELAHSRAVKLFISQQFRISESRRGDTGFYDPRVGAIIHYKGHHTFLVNAVHGDRQFTDYNIGLFGIEGREGTYLDAEDGVLERNPIEHGSVDSIIGLSCELTAKESTIMHYWIACTTTVPEAHTLDAEVLEETPPRLLTSAQHYWHAWLEKEQRDLSPLAEPLQALYNRSLITIRVHTDNRGGIIASSDTDMLHHGRDTYSYVWPRDAAVIAGALDRAGYVDTTQRFFQFMAKCLEPEGYLMHKYRVDGVLGSSWHSWQSQDGSPRLPIQEDETAIVVFMLWEHYERHRDLEFIESLYNSFIEPIGKFMADYIEPTTGLPMASFDLWEEKHGTSTYTACAVYGALMAISKFSTILGKDEDARTYQAIAQRMQTAIRDVLFDDELGMFVKHVNHCEDELCFDRTIDSSSFFGPILFDVFDVDDDLIRRALATVEARLQVQASSKGFVRYEGDNYYTMQDAGSPNPWVVTTLWVARYYIKTAQSLEDLKRPYELLEWTESHSTSAGVLAEQMHPHTREHLSTAPLIWSHAEYVITVDEYLKKWAELSRGEE